MDILRRMSICRDALDNCGVFGADAKAEEESSRANYIALLDDLNRNEGKECAELVEEAVNEFVCATEQKAYQDGMRAGARLYKELTGAGREATSIRQRNRCMTGRAERIRRYYEDGVQVFDVIRDALENAHDNTGSYAAHISAAASVKEFKEYMEGIRGKALDADACENITNLAFAVAGDERDAGYRYGMRDAFRLLFELLTEDQISRKEAL